MELTLVGPINVGTVNVNVSSLQDEIDQFYQEMQRFPSMESGIVFQKLAGYTARASWTRSLIQRQIENRAWTKFRTTQLDPFIEECDRQFRVWSRAFAVQSQEWQISKGG